MAEREESGANPAGARSAVGGGARAPGRQAPSSPRTSGGGPCGRWTHRRPPAPVCAEGRYLGARERRLGSTPATSPPLGYGRHSRLHFPRRRSGRWRRLGGPLPGGRGPGGKGGASGTGGTDSGHSGPGGGYGY